MKTRVLKSAAAALVSLVSAAGAQAAIVSGTYSFTATGLAISPIVGTASCWRL